MEYGSQEEPNLNKPCPSELWLLEKFAKVLKFVLLSSLRVCPKLKRHYAKGNAFSIGHNSSGITHQYPLKPLIILPKEIQCRRG